jgi:hypothetical protein
MYEGMSEVNCHTVGLPVVNVEKEANAPFVRPILCQTANTRFFLAYLFVFFWPLWPQGPLSPSQWQAHQGYSRDDVDVGSLEKRNGGREGFTDWHGSTLEHEGGRDESAAVGRGFLCRRTSQPSPMETCLHTTCGP